MHSRYFGKGGAIRSYGSEDCCRCRLRTRRGSPNCRDVPCRICRDRRGSERGAVRRNADASRPPDDLGGCDRIRSVRAGWRSDRGAFPKGALPGASFKPSPYQIAPEYARKVARQAALTLGSSQRHEVFHEQSPAGSCPASRRLPNPHWDAGSVRAWPRRGCRSRLAYIMAAGIRVSALA